MATNNKKKTASSIAKMLANQGTVTTTNTIKQTDNNNTSNGSGQTTANTQRTDMGGSVASKLANQGVSTAINTQKANSGGSLSYSPSQYTGVGTYNDQGVSQWAQNQINYFKEQYNIAQANGDEDGMRKAHEGAEAIRKNYGYSGGEDGSDLILLPQDTPMYDYNIPQPTYENKYDPQMETLLNEILNRDDFSYNVENDPLYQQYAQMYQREGDRAMRDTMAEAAASAGGMNSYAMTAAQQANNYYGAQLGDKIPELYQLAYDMYLADKESKVQDLGLLQSMDATQYNRYRDTMTDWQNDRNFAYGMYRDDVADAQWNKTFDYNKFVDDRNFAYDSDWANKEWNYNVGQDALDREQKEKETARDDVWKFIEKGIPPSAELLAKAGYNDSDNKYNGGGTSDYATVSNDIASMVAQGDKGGAKTYLQEALNAGYITWSECVGLIEKYGL